MEKVKKTEQPNTVKNEGKEIKPTISTMAEKQKEFERLNQLFRRKASFENSREQLTAYFESLKEKGEELESSEHRLTLGSGYNRDDFKITNLDVIRDCVKFVIARIEGNISGINAEILKG